MIQHYYLEFSKPNPMFRLQGVEFFLSSWQFLMPLKVILIKDFDIELFRGDYMVKGKCGTPMDLLSEVL